MFAKEVALSRRRVETHRAMYLQPLLNACSCVDPLGAERSAVILRARTYRRLAVAVEVRDAHLSKKE